MTDNVCFFCSEQENLIQRQHLGISSGGKPCLFNIYRCSDVCRGPDAGHIHCVKCGDALYSACALIYGAAVICTPCCVKILSK